MLIPGRRVGGAGQGTTALRLCSYAPPTECPVLKSGMALPGVQIARHDPTGLLDSPLSAYALGDVRY
eukprot:1670946-Rhodomonas_salina.1